MRKKVIAVVTTAAVALSIGAASVASAQGGMGGKGAGLSTLLSELVTKGIITQAQADAIVKAQADAKALAEANRPTEAEREAHHTAQIAVVTSTLGITADALKARVKAGDSLATIAGAKKDALIAALVAFESKEIDARVTAGKLTAAQATSVKANLTAMVTEKVNNARPMGEGRGGREKGKAPNGAAGGLVTPGTGTTSTAKYTSGLTIRA
jgi:polyhydroxyalkanoate synthesis regulator phasin